MVICLERGADLHMAQLMPLPLTVSCFNKVQIGLTFLVPAHPGSPGKRAVKRVCVCVCVIVLYYLCNLTVLDHNIEDNSFATSEGDTSAPVIFPANIEEQAVAIANNYESLPSTPVFTTPVNKCGSVSFSLGTPIEAAPDAATDSPYSSVKSLPNRSQFAEGVSDHILFENLPNATGTFQRLREVLQSLHSSSPASSTC